MSKKVYLESLGCPKNRVDSERTLWALKEAGALLTLDESEADILITNTCGFTAEAKEESVETILRLAKIKEERPGTRLTVMGCLSELYGNELKASVPEIDHIYGVAAAADVVKELGLGPSNVYPDPEAGPRLITTPSHFAYLKIAEGCSNRCSFCVIPSIRGPYKSREPVSLIQEGETLARQGVKELILVSQDTTLYGADIRLDEGLDYLLRRLAGIEGIEWIRTLYMYPALLNDRLLEVFLNEEKVAPYFDIPIQHIADNVLKKMNRPDDSGSIRKLIDKIRAKIPDASIRTSAIVGFPQETDSDFDQLLRFVEETRFDHLGAFIYSPEKGTQAYEMSGAITKEVAQERFNLLMETQNTIAKQLAMEKIGDTYDVIVDLPDPDEPLLTGRTNFQAPEIDAVVILDSVTARPGEILPIKITGASEYDLIGTHP